MNEEVLNKGKTQVLISNKGFYDGRKESHRIELLNLYVKLFISNKRFYRRRKVVHGIELMNLDIEKSPNMIAERSPPSRIKIVEQSMR